MLFTPLAAEGESAITTAFSTAISTIQSDVISYLLIALPAALVIVGAFFGIKKGVGFFKSLANK